MTPLIQKPSAFDRGALHLHVLAAHANPCQDPGFCNTNLRMIHVTVDMSRPENQNPQPELEDNEFIETFSVPLKDLWDECIKFTDQGYVIDARVGTLAEGIEFAKRWKLA
jgi:ADP-ribose pyrophosphatase